jgi:hypothetical protein
MRGSKDMVKLLLVLAFSLPMAGQRNGEAAPTGPCSMPLLEGNVNEHNLFNEQQEEWLGDIMDGGMRRDFHAIEDPDGYLQRMGERLLAQLPPTTVHYHFVIIDSPGLNSFGLAGGRIYIYRKMIAFSKNEDELASLVGHEIGHMITHQVATHMSDYFRQLGITSVGDRQDVLNKWNQFKDNSAKVKRVGGGGDQREQLIADRVGIYAMMRAGYDPAKAVEFADRSFETKGKTGSFWSDFFGTTSPESKRLREIMRNAAPLPANCIASRPDTSTFAKWQQAVVEAKVEAAREELPGLVKKVALQPPLRNELTHLQFSLDGKYLLAQDDSSIFLLTREPLANLFRIDAPDANIAQFTPDSAAVVFDDKELRVQKWDIASQRQVMIRELSSECSDSQLSPTGDAVACIRPDRELRIIDMKSGDVVFSKKNFFVPSLFEVYLAELMEILGMPAADVLAVLKVQMRFSPDGHYLVAAHGESSLAYDLNARSEVKTSGKLRALFRTNFVFTAPDEVFGVSEDRPQKALRLRFPGGDVIDQFAFSGYGQFSPAVKANYVMVRPAGIAPMGAIDLSAHKVTMGYKTLGFAIYGDFYAGDDVEGLISLCKISDKSEVARVSLPNSPLARAKASAFSDDGQWLAVSGRTRAALWKLETGDRIGFSRDFEGAFFDQGKLIVRFPKRPREAGQVASITPAPVSMTKLYELEPAELAGGPRETSPGAPAANTRTWQDDDLLIRLEPTDPKKLDHFTLDVRDVRTNTSLWQLQLDRYRPRFFYSRPAKTITFVVGNYDKIKEAAKHDPALNARIEAIGNKQGKQASYLLQVYEARSQKPLGNVLVDTGNLSFRVQSAAAAGDSVFVSDSLNRTLVYSLKSGEQRGKVFGHVVAATGSGDRVLVENGKGDCQVYDASSLQALAHFSFPDRVVLAEFTDGGGLLVLTADQTVYRLQVPAAGQTASLP